MSKRAVDKEHKRLVQTWGSNIWAERQTTTIEEMVKKPGIAEIDEVHDRKTVRGWLADVDPRDPATKRGRRRKQRH